MSPASPVTAGRLVSFHGAVRCHRAHSAPELTLTGRAQEDEADEVTLAFSASALPELPEVLEDPSVEQIAGDGTGGAAATYRLRSAAGEWLIQARAVHLHRELTAAFYTAIPPRVPPWRKRVLWRLILALAGSPLGGPLLRRLRG